MKSKLTLNDNILKIAICLLLGYTLCFFLWTIFFTETGNGDNVEHLHASWLVSQGKIPYRDFFQHHNPLLWYAFAPFITFFSNNIISLLNTAHALGITGGIVTFYIVYKICRRFFVVSKTAVCLSLIILCPPYYYVYCFNFNPDTFMILFYVMGLYYLFSYWDKPKLFDLSVSFTAFFVAFLFTQKILMILAFLCVLSLVVFYQKKTPLSDIFFALLLPFLGFVLFIAYLYHNDALELYWLSNYPFNVKMQDYYGVKRVDVMDYERLIPAVILSSVSILCFVKSAGVYFKTTAVLFVFELLLRCFYFAISPYYMLPLMVYMVCLNSVLIQKIIDKKSLFLYLSLILGTYYALISVPFYKSVRGTNRSFANFIAQNVTPCDYLISSYYSNQAITSKDPHYYWSMLGHIDVLGDEMGIRPKSDFTALVEKYKPIIVYTGPYWNSYYAHRGQNILWQRIAPEIIDKYYHQTVFPEFYILKPQYQGKNCYFDSVKKEWLYAN